MENNLASPQRAVDAVVVPPLMTKEEAHQCIDEIKGHLIGVRKLLLELEERRGWEILGYKSMRQCMLAEFVGCQSQLYRELKAGKIEKKISPQGEIGLIPEKHLRHIGSLPQEEWVDAWEQVVKTAPSKGVTTSHVAKTVAQIKLNSTKSERDELIKIDAPNRELNQLIEEVARIGDLVTIDCSLEAEFSLILYNGCWGQVISMGDGVVEVLVKGKSVKFMKSDIKPVYNPTPNLREIVEKVNRLLSREDLDELDRQIAEFYVGRTSFTDKQLERLEHLWDVYNQN
ncbi:MAG: hypothetical protein QNJ54_28940 [Prochloraceae cyanobacterium]|nr:hypothetical protein [Prochloraceae cyanobacterium]